MLDKLNSFFNFKKSLFTLLVLWGALFFNGCTHALHLYHVNETQVPKNKSKKKITAQSEQFVVLGFVQDTNYVNQAYNQLLNKCPKGSITGVHTRYSTSHGFLSWKNKIKIQAYCVR